MNKKTNKYDGFVRGALTVALDYNLWFADFRRIMNDNSVYDDDLRAILKQNFTLKDADWAGSANKEYSNFINEIA